VPGLLGQLSGLGKRLARGGRIAVYHVRDAQIQSRHAAQERTVLRRTSQHLPGQVGCAAKIAAKSCGKAAQRHNLAQKLVVLGFAKQPLGLLQQASAAAASRLMTNIQA